MARSHHRRKHKHFQPPPHTGSHKAKRNAATIFAIGGGVVALIIFYSATDGSLIWVIIGALAGGLIGYFIGRRIDQSDETK